MLNTNKLALGTVTRSRTALAFVAATLLVGGSVTEASAKSRHHHRHSSPDRIRGLFLARRQRLDRLVFRRAQFFGHGLLLRQ